MLHVVVDRGYCCGRSGHHGNCAQWVSLFTPPPSDKDCNNNHGLQKASVRWRVRRPRNKCHIIQEGERGWRAQGEYLERIANGACVLGAWRRSARSTPIFLFWFDPLIFFFLHYLGSGREGWSWIPLLLSLATPIPDGGSFIFRRRAPRMCYRLMKVNA